MTDRANERDERDIEDARRRAFERARNVERIVEGIGSVTDDLKYPVRSEEIAAEYADQADDLPNETEDLATAIDRLETDRAFDSPEALHEAIVDELTGEVEFDSLADYDRELAAGTGGEGNPDAPSDLDEEPVSPEEYEDAIPGDGGFDEYIDGTVDLPEEIKRRLEERAAARDADGENEVGEID